MRYTLPTSLVKIVVRSYWKSQIVMASSVPAIVSTAWLKDHLSDVPDLIRIIDCTWSFTEKGKDLFAREHIPGSTCFDINAGVTGTPLIPRSLPEPDVFQSYVQSLGINKDTHVVVYDGGEARYFGGARQWWQFRLFGHEKVSVLSGGLDKWKADGYEIATGDEEPKSKGNFVAKTPDPALMMKYDEMIENVKQKTRQIVDTRRPEHFNAEKDEPSIYTLWSLQDRGQPLPERLAHGRHPGAINLREDWLFKEDTKALLSKEEYLKLFERLGIDVNKKIVTTCYLGHGACIMALALAECGKYDVPVYYGSWTEYGQRAPTELIDDPRAKASSL